MANKKETNTIDHRIISTSKEATLLKDYFDPNELLKKPGTYISFSNSDAYPLLWAMAESGMIRQIGEHYPSPEIKAITVTVGKEGYKTNPIEKKTGKLKVGANFLANAINAYKNWDIIWWREAVQNSVDAKAENIELGCVQLPNGTWKVWCSDDGKGMNQKILEDVFFALGESGKGLDEEGQTTIGGFGKAKEVLILPWIDFKIHTRNIICKSKPLNIRQADDFYELDEAPIRKGTLLEVIMPADKRTTPVKALTLLRKCYLPNINITFTGDLGSGEGVKTYTVDADLRHGTEMRNFYDIAKLYYYKAAYEGKQAKKSASFNTLLIRSGGVLMFEKTLPYQLYGLGQMIVDLVPRKDIKPKDVFTDNRDGFKDERIEIGIADFIAEVTTNRLSALASKSKQFTEVFIGSGAFSPESKERRSRFRAGVIRAGIKTRTVKDQVGKIKITTDEESIDETAKQLDEDIKEEKKDRPPQAPEQITEDIITEPSGGTMIAMYRMTEKRGEQHVEVIAKQAAWKPHFMLKNTMEDVRPKPKFYPASMTSNVVKLARYWTDLCRWVLGQLGSDRQFGVGFVFSEDVVALHVHDTSQPVAHWLLINPIHIIEKGRTKDAPGTKIPWRLSDEEHIRYLYATAIHECTHLADDVGDHDELFAAAVTFNFAICANLSKAKQFISYIRMKEIAEGREDEREEKEKHVPRIPGTSTRGELEQETGIFKQEGPAGRGRPKKIFEIGAKSEFQIRYMWSHAITENPETGTKAKVEIWIADEIFASGEFSLIHSIKRISEEWTDIAYKQTTNLALFPILKITSESGSEEFKITNQDNNSYYVSRTSLTLALQTFADAISARLNFMTATYDEAKYANRDWKNKRNLQIF